MKDIYEEGHRKGGKWRLHWKKDNLYRKYGFSLKIW